MLAASPSSDISLAGLHPRRWHLLTWSVFLLWLLFTAVGNYPFPVPADAYQPPPRPEQPASAMITNYGFTMISGWPLLYLERHVDPSAPGMVVDLDPVGLVVSLLLIVVTQVSIVVVMQRFGQFSLAMLLTGVTLVGLILLGGRVAAASNGLWMIYYMRVIYFLPVAGALAVAVAALVFPARTSPHAK